jgi:hypothetical protein
VADAETAGQAIDVLLGVVAPDAVEPAGIGNEMHLAAPELRIECVKNSHCRCEVHQKSVRLAGNVVVAFTVETGKL